MEAAARDTFTDGSASVEVASRQVHAFLITLWFTAPFLAALSLLRFVRLNTSSCSEHEVWHSMQERLRLKALRIVVQFRFRHSAGDAFSIRSLRRLLMPTLL